jgi:hypothetical protein
MVLTFRIYRAVGGQQRSELLAQHVKFAIETQCDNERQTLESVDDNYITACVIGSGMRMRNL